MSPILRILLLLSVLLVPAFVRAADSDPAIEALLQRVAEQRDVVFIRNGREHDARDAAAHLRRKLAASGGRITTAEQMIDALGTRSSVTGRAYQVRLPDGRTVDSAPWLRQLLHEVRASRTTRVPAQSSAGSVTGG